MKKPEICNDEEIDLIEIIVIWFENIKIGIIAAVILAGLGTAYTFNLPNTVIISSNLVIGTQLNGSAAISAEELAQILISSHNVDNKFSDAKQQLPYLSKVSAMRQANIVQLSVIAADKTTGTALLQNILNQVLNNYNSQLNQQRQQAKQQIKTLETYIKEVKSNHNLKNNIDLSASYTAIDNIKTRIANIQATTTIPALPDFYIKKKYNLKMTVVVIAIICIMALCLIPIFFGFAKQASHSFKEIRKLRSVL